jgi:hypothetical protein
VAVAGVAEILETAVALVALAALAAAGAAGAGAGANPRLKSAALPNGHVFKLQVQEY